MSNSEVVTWQRFFLAAGIPTAVATKYSRSFANERVQFSVLEDIDRSTLADLGVNAVGDQLAILRHIKKKQLVESDAMDCEDVTVIKQLEKPVEKAQAKNVPVVSTAPDRDDVYHVRLPVGTTPKTREILKKHDVLKSAGILKRGSSGVRQSGRELSSKKLSDVISKRTKMHVTSSTEVSSSTDDDLYNRLGVRGLVSDQIVSKTKRAHTTTRNFSSNLFNRAINETAADHARDTVFRVKLSNSEYASTPRSRITRTHTAGARSFNRNTSRGSVQKKPISARLTFRRGAPVKGDFSRSSVFDRLS